MIRRWDKSKPPLGQIALNRDCVQAQGLVAWWPIGGPSGRTLLSNLVRTGATSHDLILNGTGAGITLNNVGAPAVTLDGATNYAATSVPVYTAPLSVGLWFNPVNSNSTTNYGLFSTGDFTLGAAQGARRFQFDHYGGSLRWLSVGSSVGVASLSGVSSGVWQHALGIEVTSTSRYAALNGVLSTQETTSATPGGTQNRTAIGSIFDLNAYGGWFVGGIGEVCIWSVAQHLNARLLADPGRRFELWYPLRSSKWFTQSSGAVTGTASITPAAQTVTASGTVAVGATSSITPAAQTLTASGGVAVSVTASITPAAQTLTASGTVVSGVEGTANITPAAQTVTATGAVLVLATATITPSAQTTTATGAVAVAATATITPAAHTVTAVGTVVSGVEGTASITPASQTVTASGGVAIGATSIITPSSQTMAASGGVAVDATASITPSAQTLSATGTVVSGVVGTASIVPAAQTLSASGAVSVSTTSNITPAAQTLSASGVIAIGASANITPAAHILIANGDILVSSTANITCASQTLISDGTVISGIVGFANITPAPQTLSATAVVSGAAYSDFRIYTVAAAPRVFTVPAP